MSAQDARDRLASLLPTFAVYQNEDEPMVALDMTPDDALALADRLEAADAADAALDRAEAERDELRKRIAYLADVFTLPGSAAEAGRQALIDNGFVLLYDAIAYVCRIVDPSVTGAPFAALDDPAGSTDG